MAVLERERIVDALSTFLAQQPEVRFAYLYGSRALGFARPDSDVDIAAYFNVDPLHAPELEPDLARRFGLHVQVINLNQRPAADFFAKVLPTAVVIKDSPERARWEKKTGGMVRKKKVTQKDYLVFALEAMGEKNVTLREALPLLEQVDLDVVRRGDSEAVRNFLGTFFMVFEPLESIARRMANYVHLTKRVATPVKVKSQVRFLGKQLGLSADDMEPLMKFADVRNKVAHAYWNLKEEELTNQDVRAARVLLEDLTRRVDVFIASARREFD